MSLNGVIASFATGTYTVRRRASGSYVAGIYEPAAVETILSVVGVVRPSGGRTTAYEDHTDETSESRTMLCETELKPRSPGFEPDIVEIDGEDWQVDSVVRSQHWGETHYRATLGRLPVP